MNLKTFELKREHIKLLKEANISWDDCEFGAPCMDPKRPYGNSYVEGDIIEALGLYEGFYEDEGYRPSYLEDEARSFHREMETALRVVLSAQSFEPGIYREKPSGRYWEYVGKKIDDNKIIVALDGLSMEESVELVKKIGNQVAYVKANSLFTRYGPEAIRTLRLYAKVFLDLKFYDIPNTVSNHVKEAVEMGVDMLTIHASGGLGMMEAAVSAAEGKTKVLAVTVLTSLNERAWVDTYPGYQPLSDEDKCVIRKQVFHFASIAIKAKVDGIVCSPHEIEIVRDLSDSIEIVTPGIRPSWAQKNDQKRVMTPSDAIEKGASYLVIGRPITQADDPVDAVRRIREEMKE